MSDIQHEALIHWHQRGAPPNVRIVEERLEVWNWTQVTFMKLLAVFLPFEEVERCR